MSNYNNGYDSYGRSTQNPGNGPQNYGNGMNGPSETMTFQDAIKTCFNKYGDTAKLPWMNFSDSAKNA